jgi:hypothetical protein
MKEAVKNTMNQAARLIFFFVTIQMIWFNYIIFITSVNKALILQK